MVLVECLTLECLASQNGALTMLLPIIQALLIVVLIAIAGLKDSLSDRAQLWADRVKWAILVVGLIVTVVVLAAVSNTPLALDNLTSCSLVFHCIAQ